MSVNREVLEVMTSMFKADPKAVAELVDNRVQCNSKLADHPSITVNRKQEVGLLGVLNGITWRDGERFEAMYDEENNLSGFRLMPLN